MVYRFEDLLLTSSWVAAVCRECWPNFLQNVSKFVDIRFADSALIPIGGRANQHCWKGCNDFFKFINSGGRLSTDYILCVCFCSYFIELWFHICSYEDMDKAIYVWILWILMGEWKGNNRYLAVIFLLDYTNNTNMIAGGGKYFFSPHLMKKPLAFSCTIFKFISIRFIFLFPSTILLCLPHFCLSLFVHQDHIQWL
jgi:hypothetical protein